MRMVRLTVPLALLPLLAVACSLLRAPDPIDVERIHREAAEEAARLHRNHVELHESADRAHREMAEPPAAPPHPMPDR